MSHPAILLIEDSATDALIVKHALRKGYAVDHVRTLREARERVASAPYAVVIGDYFLPDGPMLDFQAFIKEKGINVPVVVMSGQGDERVAADVLKQGAYDYIVKSEETLAALPALLAQVLKRHDLERRAQIFQQIVENASDCIITMDMEGRILTANEAVAGLLGYTPDEVRDKPARALLVVDEAWRQAERVFAARGGDMRWQGELTARRKDGTLAPVHMSTSVLKDAAGNALCLIAIARDMSERHKLLEDLKRLSVTDNLTGLANHRSFHDRLHYEFLRARRYRTPLACIMADADFFKAVNDTYGHVTGDEALKGLAEIIASAVREADIVARYGGEEFAVILPNTDLDGAVRCAENVWRAVGSRPIRTSHGPLQLTISAGVAALAPDVKSEEELLCRADSALLDAKRAGRNTVAVWRQATEGARAAGVEVGGQDAESVRASLRRLLQPALSRYMESARPLIESLFRRMPFLREHCACVREEAMRLARLAGVRGEQEAALQHAAEIHDLGHALTPPHLLRKADRTPQEEAIYRRHAETGDQLLAEMRVFPAEREIVRHHHERYDGRGYPDGLAGEAIPYGARILALADAYVLLRSGAEDEPGLSHEEALAALADEAGARFDPALLRLIVTGRVKTVHGGPGENRPG